MKPHDCIPHREYVSSEFLQDFKINVYSKSKSGTWQLGMWHKCVSAGCYKSSVCVRNMRYSGLQHRADSAGFISGRSMMTEGWKTHLEAGHGQLRQTVNVWTQDFVFPNFQGLSAPEINNREGNAVIARKGRRQEGIFTSTFNQGYECAKKKRKNKGNSVL